MAQAKFSWIVQPLALLLFGLVVFLMYQLVFAQGGLLEVFRTSKKIQQQTLVNQKLAAANRVRQRQITALKAGDMQAIESLARSELGMVKQDEQYYQIVYK